MNNIFLGILLFDNILRLISKKRGGVTKNNDQVRGLHLMTGLQLRAATADRDSTRNKVLDWYCTEHQFFTGDPSIVILRRGLFEN